MRTRGSRMPGLKVRSTSGRALQGQGLFRLFPLSSPSLGGVGLPPPLATVPGWLMWLCLASRHHTQGPRAQLGAPSAPCVTLPSLFSLPPTTRKVRSEPSPQCASHYLPQAFPLHTSASTGTPSVIWGHLGASPESCAGHGLWAGAGQPSRVRTLRGPPPSLRQVASVTLGLCPMLVSLDTFIIPVYS